MNKLEYIPGDLVRYTSLYKEPIAEICEIRETSYLIRYMNGNFAKVTNEEINPIPLTKEILQKNGWDKERIYFTHSRIPRIKLCTDSSESKWSVSINGDIMGGYINYVHELQHILFAFKIYLEMEV